MLQANFRTNTNLLTLSQELVNLVDQVNSPDVIEKPVLVVRKEYTLSHFFKAFAFGDTAGNGGIKRSEKIKKENEISLFPDIAVARNQNVEIQGLNLGNRIHILSYRIAVQS